jgi:hypothetical protein
MIGAVHADEERLSSSMQQGVVHLVFVVHLTMPQQSLCTNALCNVTLFVFRYGGQITASKQRTGLILQRHICTDKFAFLDLKIWPV